MSRRQPKNFNGLVPIGGTGHVPMIGQGQSLAKPTPEQVRAAIVAKMQEMLEEMYVRACSRLVSGSPALTSEDYQRIARECHQAAEGFFVGLGVIELDPPQEATDDSAEPQA